MNPLVANQQFENCNEGLGQGPTPELNAQTRLVETRTSEDPLIMDLWGAEEPTVS